MNFSILIAEDDEFQRKYMINALTNEGFSAVGKENGEEALKTFSANPAKYRILLVDLRMPVMDGFELIRRIRNDYTEVYPYIFVVTSLDSEDDVLRALELGADEVLIKPVSPKRLYASVVSGLQKLKMLTLDVLIKSFVRLMNIRDKYTGNHAENVRLIATLLARVYCEEADINDNFVDEIGTAALLHDVGKILIPEEILRKPTSLTVQEYELVKTHTTNGSEILRESLATHPENTTIKTCYEVIRYHHEQWNGKGYPEGLSGEEIPISARIVKVADVFDALTSERYYRKAHSPEEALEIMKAQNDHFDPKIFEIFLEHQRFFASVVKSKVALIKD